MLADPPAARRTVERGAVAFVLAVALALSFFATAASAGQQRPFGDIGLFTNVPYPGNPGGLAVDGKTLWVDTSAANLDRPFDGSSSVFAYDLGTGRLEPRNPNPIIVPKLDVAAMGLLGIALDASGRLYIADMNGQIVRVDPSTGESEVYATIPTSTSTSFTSMPTADAFGPDGSLYVSDAGGEPFIWRVPPGGGQAKLWFSDPRLSGTWGASVVGLTLDASGDNVYFAVGNQEPQITIYRLPLRDPTASRLSAFHTYRDVVLPSCSTDPNNATDPATPIVLANCAVTPFFGAGGIAFGKSGRLYVAMFAKNQISVLDPRGVELARFPSPEENAKLDVPVNGPFGLAFDARGSLLVADVGDPSYGYLPGRVPPPNGTPDSRSWAVLSAWVDDTAAPLLRPRIP